MTTFDQLRAAGLNGLLTNDPSGAIRDAVARVDNFLHGDLIDPNEVAASLRDAAAACSATATVLGQVAAVVLSNPGTVVRSHSAGAGTLKRTFI
jgi:hypothetical protein